MFLVLCLIILTGTVCQGQTYVYKRVKTIMKTGEVQEDNYNYKVYITFTNGKSSFYISKSDGSRAGAPEEATGFASGFNNMDVYVGGGSGLNIDKIGFGTPAVRDPQNFKFTNNAGEIHIYKNTRPILSVGYQQLVISEYVYDYAKFNADYSRINVILDPTKGRAAIFPFGVQDYSSCPIKNVAAYVFERVQQANVNNQEFY